MEQKTVCKENEQLKMALERVNGEYIDLLNSREYIMGKRILRLIHDFGHFDLIEIFRRLINYKNKRRVEYINNRDEYQNIKHKATNPDARIAIYTCITGSYDNIAEPYFTSDRISYYLYTDTYFRDTIWKVRKIPKSIVELNLTAAEINRYIKMHPHELFSEYDYTIYVDGKITIVSDLSQMVSTLCGYYGIGMHQHSFRNDLYNEANACIMYKKGNLGKIKEQIRRYEDEGMPRQFGMREAAVIVCDIKNQQGRQLLESWWQDYIFSKSGRDQLSLPYVVWKSGHEIDDIDIVDENNIECNRKIRINGDHK